MESPRGFYIGLIEAGPRAVGIFGFKLRVKVVASVFGIAIAMQPLPRRRKATISFDANRDLTLDRNCANVEAFTVICELTGC